MTLYQQRQEVLKACMVVIKERTSILTAENMKPVYTQMQEGLNATVDTLVRLQMALELYKNAKGNNLTSADRASIIANNFFESLTQQK